MAKSVEIVTQKKTSPDFLRRIKKLGEESLYVGIPSGSKTQRIKNIKERASHFTSSKKSSKKMKKHLLNVAKMATLSNAQALRVFSSGSALTNQPARPVIEPAIQAPGNKERIVEALSMATQLKLLGKNYEAKQFLRRAGRIARDAAQDWFFDSRNGWPGNAASTIEKKGFDQPGIDTEAMRNAITYELKGS